MSLHMLMMDAIEAQAMLRLQISLRSVSSLLALHNQPLSDMQFGFCALAQTAKDVSLQMLLPPQHFDLSQWQFALDRLSRMPANAPADHTRTAKAMKTLVEFVATHKALASCSKNLTVFGQAFRSIEAFAPVLQFAADQCIQINFVAIANSSQDGEAAASELALANFTAGLSDFESASAAYCPCDPFAIHQACLRWAHSLLNPQPVTVMLRFPSTPPQSVNTPAPLTAAAPYAQSHSQPGILQQPLPDQAAALCQLQPQSLMCRVVSEVVQLSSLLTHLRLCPCHGVPMQQLPAGALQQPLACAVTGQSLMAAQSKQNTSMVQVGHSTTLMLPSTQAANVQLSSIVQTPGKEGTSHLEIVKRIKVHSVSESLMFGWPHILVPHADSFDSMSEMQANEKSLTALCQVLEEQQQLLLLKGHIDLDMLRASSWPLHYVARPAGNGSMLVRRVATEEELVPISHLLPGQASEVPSHVRGQLEAALHAVPLSDYSPLDYHSGAFDELAGLVSQSLVRSPAPSNRAASTPGHTVSSAVGKAAAPVAPLKHKAAHAQPPQAAAVTKAAAPHAQQATTKSAVHLPPAPSFSFKQPLQPAQQNMQHDKDNRHGQATMPKPAYLQSQSQLPPSKLPQQKRGSAQGAKATTAANAAQAGPRLNFKRIRTLK